MHSCIKKFSYIHASDNSDGTSIRITQRETSFFVSTLQWNGHKLALSVAINVTHVIEDQDVFTFRKIRCILIFGYMGHIYYRYRKRQLQTWLKGIRQLYQHDHFTPE